MTFFVDSMQIYGTVTGNVSSLHRPVFEKAQSPEGQASEMLYETIVEEALF